MGFFNTGGLITRGFGEDHRIVTRGFGKRFDLGGIGPGRAVSSIYDFNILAPVLVEGREDLRILSSVRVEREMEIKFISSIFKEITETLRVSAPLDHAKLSEILDAI